MVLITLGSLRLGLYGNRKDVAIFLLLTADAHDDEPVIITESGIGFYDIKDSANVLQGKGN